MLRRPIACALLVWYLAACTTWHVQQAGSPPQIISAQQPPAVRLTRTNGSHVVVEEPRVVGGDSLAGLLHGTPFTVAVSDVTQVAIKEVDAGRTIGLALGLVALALFTGALIEATTHPGY
jgi:hypothetical protein